jgi:hypothetical protein
VASKNFHAALTIALILPDICASIENPGTGKSKDRYESWFRKWAEPKFRPSFGGDETKPSFITAANCYQIRCSLLHSGTAEIEKSKITDLARFEFFDDTTGAHLIHCVNVTLNGENIGGFLQLKASIFAEAIFDSVDEWDIETNKDISIIEQKSKLLQIRTRGFSIGGNAIVFG